MSKSEEAMFGNYRRFPPELAQLVERCEGLPVGQSFTLPGFNKSQALAARRNFHRFRSVLEEAATLEGDEVDHYARHLAAIAACLIVSIPDARDGDYSLVFRINPLVAAVRKMEGGHGR